MSSREEILKKIRVNKPALVELPVIDFQEVIRYESNTAQFKEVLERIGGRVNYLETKDQLKEIITEDLERGQVYYQCVKPWRICHTGN